MDCVAPQAPPTATSHNISPLHAKGAARGAAVLTDLATEHLHALQNGLVTHGCRGLSLVVRLATVLLSAAIKPNQTSRGADRGTLGVCELLLPGAFHSLSLPLSFAEQVLSCSSLRSSLAYLLRDEVPSSVGLRSGVPFGMPGIFVFLSAAAGRKFAGHAQVRTVFLNWSLFVPALWFEAKLCALIDHADLRGGKIIAVRSVVMSSHQLSWRWEVVSLWLRGEVYA